MRLSIRRNPPLPGCRPAGGPLALPPRAPRRKVQWGRILPALRSLRENPKATAKAFEVFEAVGGRGDDGLFQRFLRTEEGQRLLRRRPVLLELLVDREALAAMPEGSFGRAYLDFARENGFAADGLLASRDQALSDLHEDMPAERVWFFDRLTLSHDLWHVLTGYGTDELGELALLGYSRAQGLNGRAVSAFLVLGALVGGWRAHRYMWQAHRRGRRSACLVVQPWEELLPLPLEEVRARLAIPPPESVHPGGLLRLADDEVVHAAA